MADYISREEVLALETDLHFDGIEQLKYWRCRHIDPDAVELLPAADVRPVVHGEWIEDDYAYNRCSECGFEYDSPEYKTPFCPNCGADMEEEADG